jgi:hypothetical protein
MKDMPYGYDSRGYGRRGYGWQYKVCLVIAVSLEEAYNEAIRAHNKTKGGTMKKLFIVITVISIITLGLTAESFAQRGAVKWKGSGGWGPGTPYNRMYDPAKVETVSGTVEAVTQVVPMKGMYSAVAVTVKTGKETVSVHLGPEWYIGRLDTKIVKGDKIEVKGARATFDGKPAIIAAEVRKGENVLVLRDSTGIPVWSGWRR